MIVTLITATDSLVELISGVFVHYLVEISKKKKVIFVVEVTKKRAVNSILTASLLIFLPCHSYVIKRKVKFTTVNPHLL